MKRFASFMICAFLIVGALAAPAAAAFNLDNQYESYDWELSVIDTYTLGDANSDGKVNAKDALTVRKYLVDEEVEIDKDGADIVELGNITAKDLLAIRKHLAAIEDLAVYENGETVASFTIAGNDISTYSIVVPEDTVDTETVYGNAAAIFRKNVMYATGVRLTIDQTATKEHAIVFHQVEETSELGIKLEIENYIYEVVDGDLHIYSTRRGALHAVFDILEEYLGFRYYANNITHQYEVRSADIAEGTYVFNHPVLDFRHCSQSFGGTNVGVHRHPRHLNGSQAGGRELKWGTQTGPEFINAHSYGYYWKMANGYVNWDTAGQYEEGASEEEIRQANLLYAAKYESGFQQEELNWNPCFTADEDYAVLFRGLLETIRYMHTWRGFRFPTSSMSFSICDSPVLCTCVDCRKISSDEYFKKDNVYGLGAGGAGQCLHLVNRAARDVKQYYEGRVAGEELPYEPNDPNDPYGPSDYYDTALDYGMPIYDEWPELSLYTILYDHSLPVEALKPEQNIIIMYCGTACNNHYVGTYDCNGSKNVLGGDGDFDVDSLKAWGKVCNEVGAQMWYWYYPVTYCSHIVDAPNITNIYHDIKFLVENCYVNGVYYEGTGQQTYQFEYLKAHLASMVMYSIQYDEEGNMSMMTEEEMHECIKEYLFLYYGEGYEYIYEYLLMYEAASDAISDEEGRVITCYINNHDRPGDMFSYFYIQDHYLEMRELLLKALELADDEVYCRAGGRYYQASQYDRVMFLLAGCDTLGLSANHKDWWADPNATAENKAFYEETYRALYNTIKEYGLSLYSEEYYKLPAEVELDKSPLHSFNGTPSWNMTDNEFTWGASDDMPDWGYYG